MNTDEDSRSMADQNFFPGRISFLPGRLSERLAVSGVSLWRTACPKNYPMGEDEQRIPSGDRGLGRSDLLPDLFLAFLWPSALLLITILAGMRRSRALSSLACMR